MSSPVTVIQRTLAVVSLVASTAFFPVLGCDEDRASERGDARAEAHRVPADSRDVGVPEARGGGPLASPARASKEHILKEIDQDLERAHEAQARGEPR